VTDWNHEKPKQARIRYKRTHAADWKLSEPGENRGFAQLNKFRIPEFFVKLLALECGRLPLLLIKKTYWTASFVLLGTLIPTPNVWAQG